MTIQNIYDTIDIMSKEERENELSKLSVLFSPISINTLKNFQDNWDRSKSFDEFVKEQNKVIKECIRCETSETLGDSTRKMFNLDILRMNTKID